MPMQSVGTIKSSRVGYNKSRIAPQQALCLKKIPTFKLCNFVKS